jgi:GNAT superfamily N-acetyltransferase
MSGTPRHPDAERIASGMVAAMRRRFGAVRSSELLEVDGLLLAISNLPDPSLNAAYVVRAPSDPAPALAAAEREFDRRGLSFGIDLEAGRHPALDAAVRSSGLDRLITRPGMTARVDDLPEATLPRGIRILPVADRRDALALARVDALAFGGDANVAGRFHAAGVVDVDGCRGFVAWEGEEPVASAVAYLDEGAVGVFGVAVVPAARRRGIGTAITAFAIDDVRGRADLAWLHPSPGGLPVYERMGFRRVCDWEVWIRR